MKSTIFLTAIFLAISTSTFAGQGPGSSRSDTGDQNSAREYAPGQQKESGESAKEYAPGQVKERGESAKEYAPGQVKRTEPTNQGSRSNNR
jgi:hypothetical protein